MDLRRICERRRRDRHSVCKCLIIGRSFQVNLPINYSENPFKHLRSGDPTDTSIKLRPLEPASGQALARDLVLKTRRRKGLGDQIAVSKYLDDEFVVSALAIFDHLHHLN
jgi:hypothetical protein